ncbi:hypothetical protein [Mucilaginibacter sp.]|jgi:hypothetical protein|uniref:hypothetical protein n=1 Tax=Mucilaginibacter sp. TaxID=1882438 RepID=UPI0035661B2A
MSRSALIILAAMFYIALAACNRNKPKPVSSNITKQTVVVNGKKDSVINNAKKNYGNATVSEPCVKCLIQVVQSTDNYRTSVAGAIAKNIIYNVNWVKAEEVADTTNGKGSTSALRLDIVEKGVNDKKLSSFIYDNSLAKLYFLKNASGNEKNELKTNEIVLKKIRNACYWGVASGN